MTMTMSVVSTDANPARAAVAAVRPADGGDRQDVLHGDTPVVHARQLRAPVTPVPAGYLAITLVEASGESILVGSLATGFAVSPVAGSMLGEMGEVIEIHVLGRFSVRRGGQGGPLSAFEGKPAADLVRMLWPPRLPADPAANLRVPVIGPAGPRPAQDAEWDARYSRRAGESRTVRTGTGMRTLSSLVGAAPR